MMTSPFATYAADTADILLSDVTDSLDFALYKDGEQLLSEHYSRDDAYQIRITGLAAVLTNALEGQLEVENLTDGMQPGASAEFFIRAGQYEDSARVCASRMSNPADPMGTRAVMCVARETEAPADRPFYVSASRPVVLSLLSADGSVVQTATLGVDGGVQTLDCARLARLSAAPVQAIQAGSDLLLHLTAPACADAVTVRFLNRYDMPETVTAQWMEEKPAVQDSTGMMDGTLQRFGIRNTTEYTLHSGPMHHDGQADQWADLAASRRAQLLWQGRWVDILMTRTGYTRRRRRFYQGEAQVSFRTADPKVML